MSHVTDCLDCPLRCKPLFVPMSRDELAFMRRFKKGEIDVQQGQDVMSQGQKSPILQTVLSGMAVRSLLLEDGRRQVINFIFPGDLLGLQSGLMGESRHSVTALTDMTLCTFPRGQIWNLFVNQPERAYDLTWIAAVEEHFLGETVATLGQRDALERVAWALSRIWQRLVALGMEEGGSVPFPFRQQDLADALGLSIVHTNRRIVALRQAGLVEVAARRLVVHDPAKLSDLAQIDKKKHDVRPIL